MNKYSSLKLPYTHIHTAIYPSQGLHSHILYTYTVSRVAYTDEYRACIWTSLGEFYHERYESVYVTLLTVKCFTIPILRIYSIYHIYRHFIKAKTLLGQAIHNGMSPLRETVIVTLGLIGSIRIKCV